MERINHHYKHAKALIESMRNDLNSLIRSKKLDPADAGRLRNDIAGLERMEAGHVPPAHIRVNVVRSNKSRELLTHFYLQQEPERDHMKMIPDEEFRKWKVEVGAKGAEKPVIRTILLPKGVQRRDVMFRV